MLNEFAARPCYFRTQKCNSCSMYRLVNEASDTPTPTTHPHLSTIFENFLEATLFETNFKMFKMCRSCQSCCLKWLCLLCDVSCKWNKYKNKDITYRGSSFLLWEHLWPTCSVTLICNPHTETNFKHIQLKKWFLTFQCLKNVLRQDSHWRITQRLFCQESSQNKTSHLCRTHWMFYRTITLYSISQMKISVINNPQIIYFCY